MIENGVAQGYEQFTKQFIHFSSRNSIQDVISTVDKWNRDFYFVIYCSSRTKITMTREGDFKTYKMSVCGALSFVPLLNVCKIIQLEELYFIFEMSLCVRKPTVLVPNKSDTNRAVQSQKMVRGWEFWI